MYEPLYLCRWQVSVISFSYWTSNNLLMYMYKIWHWTLLHVLSYYGSLVIQFSHYLYSIGIQFQWDEWQLHVWGGSLLQSAKYPSVQTLDNITRCTAQSSVPSSHLYASSHNLKSFLFALTLITMIIITLIHTVTCHVCHCLRPKAKQNNTFVSCNIGLQNRVGR